MSFLASLLSALANSNAAERHTAEQALVALDADSDAPWLLHEGNAGSHTMANVGGQVIDISSPEYAAWWNANFGDQYPLD
jgi:hypothetical protein